MEKLAFQLPLFCYIEIGTDPINAKILADPVNPLFTRQ